MFVSSVVVCCVGSGLCDELGTLSEKSYRMRVCVCVFVCVYVSLCDLETSTMRQPRPDLGFCAPKKLLPVSTMHDQLKANWMLPKQADL